ncbi:MAG: glycosyltransferase family 2 protein, partial [Spirulinaceae cyanobacterium]
MIEPFVSVIIPTYGREELLVDSIADTLGQTYPQFEVLVVDQTPEHTPAVAAYLQEQADQGAIRWLRLPWASLPGARNLGVRQARGEIVVFIDDDIQMPPGYLAAHVQNYQRPDVGVVAGRVFDRMKLADAKPNHTIDYLPPEARDPGIAWYHIDLVHTTKPQPVIS